MDGIDVGAALLGGAIAGMGLAVIHPIAYPVRVRAVIWHALLLGWVGALYFVGRLAVAFERGDEAQAMRLAAAIGLWALFSLASIPAGLATYRARR